MEEEGQPRRCSRLVAQRHDLHGRDLRDARESHLRQGASLKDPSSLFNSSLEGDTRRAIDIHDGEKINERAFKALIKEAAALNLNPRRK